MWETSLHDIVYGLLVFVRSLRIAIWMPGFYQGAEVINGRAAMIGLFALMLLEGVSSHVIGIRFEIIYELRGRN